MKISLKNKLSILAVIVVIAVFIFSPKIIHAETHVKSHHVYAGTTWTKEGSPYILDESIYLGYGKTLNIGKGVTVKQIGRAHV